MSTTSHQDHRRPIETATVEPVHARTEYHQAASPGPEIRVRGDPTVRAPQRIRSARHCAVASAHRARTCTISATSWTRTMCAPTSTAAVTAAAVPQTRSAGGTLAERGLEERLARRARRGSGRPSARERRQAGQHRERLCSARFAKPEAGVDDDPRRARCPRPRPRVDARAAARCATSPTTSPYVRLRVHVRATVRACASARRAAPRRATTPASAGS